MLSSEVDSWSLALISCVYVSYNGEQLLCDLVSTSDIIHN